MLDAMKSLRDEMLALQKKESGVDKTSDSAQANPTPETSQTNPPTRTFDLVPSDYSEVQPMDLEPYGPPLPPKSTKNLTPSMLYTWIVTPIPSTTDSEYLTPIPSTTRYDLSKKNILTNLSCLQRKMNPLRVYTILT